MRSGGSSSTRSFFTRTCLAPLSYVLTAFRGGYFHASLLILRIILKSKCFRHDSGSCSSLHLATVELFLQPSNTLAIVSVHFARAPKRKFGT